ncbi:hypothetical protein C461_10923 [Halorubrum aidingense JCM 13560]|uniref:Uncharacterized protein n=1 Tax=Halorubrum aidingense JCM 13560 TaxID=1230454 RepID=M0P9P4_9EURY|nr:hypothetical protein [Halorubrum aidingense]EMA66548.1 hypothetical protein C461_10923 [Halorubrum aidingense JCM 13560]
MTDSDDSGGASLASLLGAVVSAFLVVTPVSALLLGFNWTQAVLIGGFGSVVAVASATVTARRAGDGDD